MNGNTLWIYSRLDDVSSSSERRTVTGDVLAAGAYTEFWISQQIEHELTIGLSRIAGYLKREIYQ